VLCDADEIKNKERRRVSRAKARSNFYSDYWVGLVSGVPLNLSPMLAKINIYSLMRRTLDSRQNTDYYWAKHIIYTSKVSQLDYQQISVCALDWNLGRAQTILISRTSLLCREVLRPVPSQASISVGSYTVPKKASNRWWDSKRNNPVCHCTIRSYSLHKQGLLRLY
jgi:hypothetical protein